MPRMKKPHIATLDEVVITRDGDCGVDDREFNHEEFGTMLTTFSGWGMRIVFVPDTDLVKRPVIVVRDPKD